MQNASHLYQSARARTAPAVRTVLALGSALVFACALLTPAVQAQEAQPPRVERQQQPREMSREMQRQERQEAQRQEMLRQEMQRQEMQRHEERAFEEQQRRLQAQQEPQQEERRRNGRMTADERSELRRQINEANQDIYARPRGRR